MLEVVVQESFEEEIFALYTTQTQRLKGQSRYAVPSWHTEGVVRLSKDFEHGRHISHLLAIPHQQAGATFHVASAAQPLQQ